MISYGLPISRGVKELLCSVKSRKILSVAHIYASSILMVVILLEIKVDMFLCCDSWVLFVSLYVFFILLFERLDDQVTNFFFFLVLNVSIFWTSLCHFCRRRIVVVVMVTYDYVWTSCHCILIQWRHVLWRILRIYNKKVVLHFFF